MDKDLFFNNNSLCIFTDASTLQTSKKPYIITTAPAVIFYINGMEVFRTFEIVQNCHSSYEGEQRAFSLAMAWLPTILSNYPYVKNVRVFTDNISTLKTYRDYIPEASGTCNEAKFRLKNKGEEDPRCCGLITSTVYYILYNNIKLELYHTFGHIGTKHPYSEVSTRFVENNWQCQGNNPSKEFIDALRYGNNAVDHYSTYVLRQYCDRNFIIPVQFYIDWRDDELMKEYNSLVEGEWYGIGNKNGSAQEHLYNRLSN